jgi:hypothetical protein
MPVRGARYGRERGGNRENGCAIVHEDPIQLGKTQIVADRQPDAPCRCVGRHRLVPRIHRVRLAIGLFPVRQVDVEEVDLAINGSSVAAMVHNDAGAVDALGLG